MKRAGQLTLVLALVTSTSAALEESRPLSRSDEVLAEKIVNGLTTTAFPSVVALLSDDSEFCTGTLIGCDTVLTAAHCVCSSSGQYCTVGGPDLTPAESIEVFSQHAGFYSVSSIAVPANFSPESAGDIAVLRLKNTVNGISPTPINTRQSPGFGVAGLITGFGLTSGLANDNGVKRTGLIISAACSGAPEGSHICWDFTLPLGAPGEDSNTCIGDSGGPLFMDLGCGLATAGVTSGGTRTDCQPNDSSYDTDVFVERSWVQSQGGDDLLNVTCGGLGPVGTLMAVIYSGEGHLESSNDQDFWSLDVAPEIGVVNIGLNGEDGVGNDFDLYIKRGGQPSTSDYDCRSIRGGTYETCRMLAPAAETWHILVDLYSGMGGNYQVVVTPFEDNAAGVLYAVGSDAGDSSSALYRVDKYSSNPTSEVIGEVGVTLFDIAIDPTTDRAYGISEDVLYELNAITGVATVIGFTGGPELNALEFDGEGQAYGWGGSGGLYLVNTTTGAATLLGFTGFSSGGDLAFDRDGTLYGATNSQLIRINTTSGVGTLVGSFGFTGAFGLEIESDGGAMYVGRGAAGANSAEIYIVNKASGVTALVGPIGGMPVGLFGLSFLESPDTNTLFWDGFESGGVCAWSSSVR